MKKISLLILILVLAFSCKEKEGCMNPLSLNYNPDATKDNHDCDYSTATFYASGNTHNGVEVLEIVIRMGQSLGEPAEEVGVINTFNHAFPTHCAVAGAVNYKIQTGDSHTWYATYNLVEDGLAYEQGTFSPSRSETCIQIDVLP